MPDAASVSWLWIFKVIIENIAWNEGFPSYDDNDDDLDYNDDDDDDAGVGGIDNSHV